MSVKKCLLGVCLAFSLFPAAASAAGSPADVRLEVAGSTKPLLAQTSLRTTTTPVAKDGTHQCSGTSVAGALEDATAGNWAATYFASFGSYGVDAIEGEAHPFSGGDSWALYVNGRYSQTGVCETELQTGDFVQFFPQCGSATSGCYGDPLQLTAPATAKPSVAFGVSVSETKTTYGGAPDYAITSVVSPSSGANVGGVKTAADGKASVTIATRGPAVVTASKPGLAPSTANVCITDGADGYCGTTAAPGVTPPATTTPAPSVPAPAYSGPVRAQITFAKEKQSFASGKGPRTLSGTVQVPPAGLKDVALRLTRTVGKKTCSSYDAKRERFVKAKRCGAAHAKFFSIGDRAAWSYLLPSALAPGRYVLDVRATDATGKADTTLQRGRNRIVFTVS